MTDLAVVVPIKALDRAKQRLSGLLSPAERASLSLAMATDVLRVITTAVGATSLWVCCGDTASATLASEFGANILDESSIRGSGLNRSVRQASRHLQEKGWQRILVIHADLPWLGVDEVELASCFDEEQLMLVADHLGEGSTLLGWGLRTGFIPGYGEHSFERHRARAAALGLMVVSPRLHWASLDVDSPADLALLLSDSMPERAVATRRWLASTTLPERLRRALHP